MLTAAGNATEFIFFNAAANFAIAAAVYCLFWFFVTVRSIFFALRSLLCVLPCSHIAGICEQQQQTRPRVYKVLVLVAPSLLSLPLMLIGRSELTKLVTHPHKEPNICCLIRPDKNTLVTVVSPL